MSVPIGPPRGNPMDRLVESLANTRFGDFISSIMVSFTVLALVSFFVYHHMNIAAFCILFGVVTAIGVFGIKQGLDLDRNVYGFELDSFDPNEWSSNDSSDSDNQSANDSQSENDLIIDEDFEVEE